VKFAPRCRNSVDVRKDILDHSLFNAEAEGPAAGWTRACRRVAHLCSRSSDFSGTRCSKSSLNEFEAGRKYDVDDCLASAA